MTSIHFAADEYAFYALGNLDPGEGDELSEHLRDGCEVCVSEAREARDVWFVIATLTDLVAGFRAPALTLREKIIGIGR